MKIRRVPTERFPPVRPATPPAQATKRRGSAGRPRTGSRPLAGKRLAAAAHPVAMRLDPIGAGFGPRDLLDAVHAAGLRLDGDDEGYMALYTALNAPTGLFARTQRGRYVWLVPERDRPD